MLALCRWTCNSMWRLIAIAAVSIVLPLFAAPQAIRKIDFKNATYACDEANRGVPSKWQCLSDSPHGSVQLKNGRHRFSEGSEPDDTVPYLMLVPATYADLDAECP